jgi:hypothetical protein
MPSPSTTRRSIATRVGLTLGGGSAGWLGALAASHEPATAATAAAAGIAALAVICTALPEIIRSRGEAKSSTIRETAEAQALLMRTETRTALLRAGLSAGTTPQALDMLRQGAIDTDLPQGRRLNDEALAKLHTVPRPRSPGKKPGNGPTRPDRGSKGNVVPLHPEQQLPMTGTEEPARSECAATRHATSQYRKYAYEPAMISAMAAIAGRRRRASTGGLNVLLQGRVNPEIKEKADRGAAARGVSIARYLEILIEGDAVADNYVEPDPSGQLDLGISA